ncbi:MAG: hypothetical protein PHN78_03670 [Dehalococcoidales bacterium]|nr:hypothetical protein [Dehalococcoidales bacterium]
MAKMVSPAGDMEVKIRGLGCDGNKFTLVGQIGVWDSTIYLEPGEVLQLAKLMLKPSLLLYIITIPFHCIAENQQKKKEARNANSGS